MGHPKPQKLLWIDIEMTGLDPVTDKVLEVGAIISDFEFKEFASYEAVIHQSEETLEKMKQAPWYDWVNGERKVAGSVYDMHTQSGLLDRVIASELTEADVETELIKLVDTHLGGVGFLAGNSIHQDRRFVRTQLPKFEEKLHYRMLDVSSFKLWMQGAYGISFGKPQANHRALEDIRGSIAELQYYLKKLSTK